MKSTFIGICTSGFMLLSASAELQFPDFASLSPADQQVWGYTVTTTKGGNPNLGITISPKAAAACQGARLYIRDDQRRTLAEINTGLTRAPDGSLSISISLLEALRGSAELIVYSAYVDGAPITPNFGGFTFRLSSPQP